MGGINPFVRIEGAKSPPNRPAFERLDHRYQQVCKEIAGKHRSPQNKRIRQLADEYCIKRGIPIK